MVHAHVGGDCCPLGDSAHGRGVPGRRRELLLLRWCGTEPPAAARHDEGVRARQQGGREQTHIHGILLLFRGVELPSPRSALFDRVLPPASLESKTERRRRGKAGTSEGRQEGTRPRLHHFRGRRWPARSRRPHSRRRHRSRLRRPTTRHSRWRRCRTMHSLCEHAYSRNQYHPYNRPFFSWPPPASQGARDKRVCILVARQIADRRAFLRRVPFSG